MPKRHTILLVCLLLAGRLLAQRLTHTPIVFLDIQQGLSNNTVRCIYKDHNGFMWFGTRDGLNRYDGNTFTVFRHQFNDSNSLISNYIQTLYEDSAGKLWIGTRQGLDIYDKLSGRFTIVSWTSAEDHRTRPLTSVIKQLVGDGHGNILIGTENQGLLFRGLGDTTAIQIPLEIAQTQSPAPEPAPSEAAQSPAQSPAPITYRYGIRAIQVDAAHRIWVQVQKQGLCLLDPKTHHLHLVNAQLPMAGSLETSGSKLWTGDGKTLYSYDPATNTYTRIWQFPTVGNTPDEIWTLKKDHNDDLLIATLDGRVLTWDPKTNRLLPEPLADSIGILQYGTIYDLYPDESGSLWIATAKGGLGIADPERSRFHTHSNLPGIAGNPADFVTSFVETADSNLYIGTEGNGILIYHRKEERYTRCRSLTNSRIINMCKDRRGQIWVAAQSQGIDRIDPVTGSCRHYFCNPTANGQQERNWVWMIYIDHRGDIWATTLRQVSLMGALYRYDPAADKFVVFDTGLSDLFTLLEDSRGTLWGGNLNQLVEIDRDGRYHHTYSVGNPVHSIFEDSNGHLWLGTEGGGLLLFDRDRRRVTARYTTDQGLCNNSVYAMLQDNAGDLWISTAGGLSRFDQTSAQFRNYFEADGLQSNEFIYNAALRLRSGEFAFGGIKGFNLFDPRTIRDIGRMPRLMLTGITVNGIPVEKDPSVVSRWGADQIQEIRVPYNKAFFIFDFTALEYSAPKEIDYAYRMDGWDRQWTETGHQRKAIYTHLDEGSYTFRVRSTNAEGRWNPNEITLHLIVLPPWYRTWWAWTLYVLAAASLIALWLVYRDRQTKLRYQIAMARANAEKEKAENERKLSFFTNISHEFRTPLTLIINPVKDLLKKSAEKAEKAERAEKADKADRAGKTPDDNTGLAAPELHIIHRNARRMLSLVDQIMLFRKADSGADTILPVKLDLYQLCREVYFSFSQQARSRNIRYEFDCDSRTTEIYADREKLEIILFNLVSNALKYTPDNGSVFLHIREQPDRLAVEVADSGPGIPAGVGDKIFERFYQVTGNTAPPKPGFGIGLFLARQFARAHKGDLSYHSDPGKGTVFTLALLKGVTHYQGTVLHEDDSKPSEIFKELVDEDTAEPAPITPAAAPDTETLRTWVMEGKTMLIVDDDTAMRQYIAAMFKETFTIYEASEGDEALRLARGNAPDIVISDIRMQGLNGIDLCRALRKDPLTVHIPVILLTGTLAPELQLEGVEGGADDYLTKPFDKELLRARVANLLQSRSNLRTSIFNEITHGQDNAARKISAVDKTFLDKCTAVIEAHLDEEEFNIQTLAMEMGISHSSLYKKIKSLSGHSLNAFIRLVRLRNAAILCINTDYNVNEIAIRVGIFDRTHFREQFQKVYGMTAAEYIRKYRKPLASEYPLRPLTKGKDPDQPSKDPK